MSKPRDPLQNPRPGDVVRFDSGEVHLVAERNNHIVKDAVWTRTWDSPSRCIALSKWKRDAKNGRVLHAA